MKILLLSRYARKGASSRLRLYQYLPYLKSAGMQFDVRPFFGDDYLEFLYKTGRRAKSLTFKAVLKRLKVVLDLSKYDAVWLEYEFLPWSPACIEQVIKRMNMPLIVEYDDPIFHRYNSHQSFLIRLIVGQKIEHIIRSASLVIVGNDYLLEKVKKVGARNVAQIPTVVDLNKYHVKCHKASSDFTIGWIGTPITAEYIRIIEPALKKLCREGSVRIVLVGAGLNELSSVQAVIRVWDESTEVQEIQAFDVGIMPLTDSPWAQGKSGFKIIQYMACGLPVIASPVGYNSLLVQDGINGYLVRSTDEWVDRLRYLKDNPAIRKEMGRRGREIVAQKYCMQVTAPLVKKLLQEAVKN